ncbi:DNA methyltransferase, partial [Pseudoalteromonas piscicida]|uniref:DNA methyltransferase n=2 Tax=Pseudoalteromonas TaxID=53246 RepID=UPI0024B5540A
SLGKLYRGDCYKLLKSMENDSVDLVFADPPFNLAKMYPSEMDDNIKTEKYLHWCQEWINECARILKPGGSMFIWNLPKWNAS